ncbi:MAG: tRNA pseudouridine(38-40) synthase TruA [Sphingopyxis sp.]
MPRYALTLEWDGRPFMGWQRQSHGPSVQAALEQAASQMGRAPIIAHAAGRTDAGVHARAMRAHIDYPSQIDPFRLMEGLNGIMRPQPISVIACTAVADDWHARFSCVGRVYDYLIINRRAPLTLEHGLAWQVKQTLDAQAMHDAAQILVGRHDFTTFRSAHCQSDSPVKTLDRLDVAQTGDRIVIRAEARSFLHHQVRSMVGCLMMVGRGQWNRDDMAAALSAANRAALGQNAPPDGLYFVGARYPAQAA